MNAVSGQPTIRSHAFWVILLITPALILRFYQILQFPMIYWDEGLWNLGPKHAVMLGDPFVYGWRHIFLSPWHYFVTHLFYTVFTPSLAVSRMFSGLMGLGSILFIYLIGIRFFNPRVGLIAALLASYNSLLVFSSRQAMLEPEVTFYLLGAVYFWFHPRKYFAWISGLFLGIALLVKIYAIAIIPALLVGQLLWSEGNLFNIKHYLSKITIIQWIGLGAGLILCFGVYGSLYLSYPDGFSQTWLIHSVERAENTILGETPTRFWDVFDFFRFIKQFLLHIPEILLLSLIGLVFSFRNKMRGSYFLFAWLCFNFLLVSAQAYRPVRYYYPIIPALILLSAFALDQLFKDTKRITTKRILISLIVLSLFQIWRFTPFYQEGLENNRPMLAASDWLNTNVPTDEPVISMYQTALLIRRPIIPAPQFLDERWRASQNSGSSQKLPWSNYFFWTTFKSSQRDTPFNHWAKAYFEQHFETVETFGKFYTIWRSKPE